MVNISSIDRFFLDSTNRNQRKSSFLLHLGRLSAFLSQLPATFIVMAIAAVLCIAALLSFPNQSLAAPTAGPPGEEITPVEAGADEAGADIAVEKIDQFSQAYLQVLQLLSDREAEIPAAETSAEALKIEKSIEADAIAIIQDNGLTMVEYMKILSLASQDAAFQDQVLGRMDESQE